MLTRKIKDELDLAAELLGNGGLVAVPTETVYGLAGNGLDEQAVERIYEVKGRPAVKPLSLMVPDAGAIERLCVEAPEQAYLLAGRFWPGPLTLVMKAGGEIPGIVLAGGTTVGLRCPDHPLTLELLRRCPFPLAAPSANPSGQASPKNAETVREYFDGKIEAIVDGGPCGIGLESTLLDLSRTPFRILRQGALPAEAIADALVGGMRIVGVTGPSGSGKTTLLRLLEEEGALALDCDEVYHELLETDAALLDELAQAFPGSVRGGALDRGALGAVVFSDPAALETLNRITHRHVTKEVNRRLREYAMSGGTLAAIDAVELIASGITERCTDTVAVLADAALRLERIVKRDGISPEAAKRRIAAQKPDSYYREHCGHVLLNHADTAAFEQKCRQLLKEILSNG